MARARGVAVHADAAALAGLAVLAGVMVALTWATWGDLGRDTGYDMVAAQRVADGQLPYVDYVYYYGPLAPMLAGLAAWLGGAGIEPMIGFGLVVALLCVVATYALGRMLAGPLGGFLAGAITVPVALGPTNFSFVLPHSFSATLGILLALCFALAVGQYAAARRDIWLVAAGASAGLIGLTRPEFAIAVLVAAVIWLGLRWHAGSGGWRETFLFSALALGIPAVVYGAFAAGAGLHRLVLENIYPQDTLAEAGNWVLKIHAPFTAASFVDLGVKLALYGVGCAALVLLGLGLARLAGRQHVVAIATGAVLFAALVGVAVARSETLRYWLEFAYGWIPAGAAVAVVVLLVRYRRRIAGWTPAAQVELVAAVILTVLAVKTYAAFFVNAPHAQPAVYAIPLAAVFLARLHLVEFGRQTSVVTLGAVWLAFLAAAGIGLTIKDAAAESARISGSGGSLAALPTDAVSLQPALDLIGAYTDRGRGDSARAAAHHALYALGARTHCRSSRCYLAPFHPSRPLGAIAALERAGVRPLSSTVVRSPSMATPASEVVRLAPRRLDPKHFAHVAAAPGREAHTRLMSGSVGGTRETRRRHRGRGLHRVASVRSASRRGMRSSASMISPVARWSTSIGASTTRRFGSRCSTAPAGACSALRSTAATRSCTWPLRRSPLRRHTDDARGERRRRQRGGERALSLDADLVIASTSDVYGNGTPPFARTTHSSSGRPRHVGGRTPSRSSSTSTCVSRSPRSAVSASRSFGSSAPTVPATIRHGGVVHRRPSSRRCSTAT